MKAPPGAFFYFLCVDCCVHRLYGSDRPLKRFPRNRKHQATSNVRSSKATAIIWIGCKQHYRCSIVNAIHIFGIRKDTCLQKNQFISRGCSQHLGPGINHSNPSHIGMVLGKRLKRELCLRIVGTDQDAYRRMHAANLQVGEALIDELDQGKRVFQLEFLQNFCPMCIHRSGREEKFLCYFLGRTSLFQQLDDVDLAIGE